LENISLEEIIKSYDKDVCFFSLCVGSDISFYDKKCVENGNFAWSDYKLGNTIFIDPIELFEDNEHNGILFRFESGEDLGGK